MIKDTAYKVIETLQEHPVLKGIFPSIAAGSLTFVDGLEIGLRITGLVSGIMVAGLTGYAQWLKIKKFKNDN